MLMVDDRINAREIHEWVVEGIFHGRTSGSLCWTGKECSRVIITLGEQRSRRDNEWLHGSIGRTNEKDGFLLGRQC